MSRAPFFLLISAAITAAAPTLAVAADDPQLAEILQRLAAIEARLTALEAQSRHVAPPTAATADLDKIQKQQKQAARKRMAADRDNFQPEQLAQAERLYQVANNQPRSNQAKQNLEELLVKFPEMNRTGCGLMYLAQWSSGAERAERLQQAIDLYNGCYYGDGAQVGALARFLLAQHYLEQGDKGKARQLFDDLRQNFATAIDHRGELLTSQIPN
ncbi:MAG: hypothetical protein K1X71_00030 [Pirellulales bacterium]|nr:hypothetical protein [Pirellulales bacterium]